MGTAKLLRLTEKIYDEWLLRIKAEDQDTITSVGVFIGINLTAQAYLHEITAGPERESIQEDLANLMDNKMKALMVAMGGYVQ